MWNLWMKSAGGMLSSTQRSVGTHMLTLTADFSKYISKSRTKRLPLTTKRAGKGFYKGNGARKEGVITSKGTSRLLLIITWTNAVLRGGLHDLIIWSACTTLTVLSPVFPLHLLLFAVYRSISAGQWDDHRISRTRPVKLQTKTLYCQWS